MPDGRGVSSRDCAESWELSEAMDATLSRLLVLHASMCGVGCGDMRPGWCGSLPCCDWLAAWTAAKYLLHVLLDACLMHACSQRHETGPIMHCTP